VESTGAIPGPAGDSFGGKLTGRKDVECCGRSTPGM
jgi:hypothetical protein